jgi:GTP-binding protein
MIPVIAIVGRPNTGKSTLFNRLTGTQDALVADQPGVTRDRNYGFSEHQQKRYILIDTGGLNDIESDDKSIADLVSGQSRLAIEESDLVFWVVDGRDGLTTSDELLARQLRPLSSRLILLVNKTEGMDSDIVCADFHALGIGTPYAVSAQRGYGLDKVLNIAFENLPDIEQEPEPERTGLRITVAGRPNVGKSTLINRILGEERLLTFDKPGTTRDSIVIPFERQAKQYELVDTAGVRRNAKLKDKLEKFSVIKTIKAIDSTDIVIIVIDASEALTDQDMHLLGLTYDSGKPLIVAANKWDFLEKSQKEKIRNQLDRKLGFVDYATVHYISALHGSGVGKIFTTVDKIGRVISNKVKPSKLTEILADAISEHAPPMIGGRRIKLRYAHLGGHNPFRIIIHGSQTNKVPAMYSRYLSKYFRKRLKLTAIPIFIEFKYGENPYRNKRNVLTPGQLKNRRRVIKHSKR